jgi:hypothetical protein
LPETLMNRFAVTSLLTLAAVAAHATEVVDDF